MKLFACLAVIAAFPVQDGVPKGLQINKDRKVGYGCLCHEILERLPDLPGAEAKSLGHVGKHAKLGKGTYAAEDVSGELEMTTGTLYVRGSVTGRIRIPDHGATVFVKGDVHGQIEVECPFLVIVGGSVDGTITATHKRADETPTHGRCGVIVGWCPDDAVATGDSKHGEKAQPSNFEIADFPRKTGITMRGTIRATEVAVLGTLEGTVDSGGSGLGVHADDLNLDTAHVVGGGQHLCLQRFAWKDYRTLVDKVLNANFPCNPRRDTQLTFCESDIPPGFYKVTDPALRPRLNGVDCGSVTILVKAQAGTPTDSERRR